MKLSYLCVYIVITMGLLSSCVGFTNIVEAESIGKKSNTHTFVADAIYVPIKDGADGFFPSGHYVYGRGLSEKTDAYLKVSSNLFVEAMGKYQVYQSPKTAVAIGASCSFGLRTPHPALHAFSQFHMPKYDILVNPSLELSTLTFANNSGARFGPILSNSLVFVKTTGSRIKLAVNAAVMPLGEHSLYLGLGLAYEFRLQG